MGIIDLLYPKKCLECKLFGNYICRRCLNKIPRPKLDCPICNKPSIDGITHVKCFKPYGLDGLFSIFSYQGVIRKAIINLKYRFALDTSRELINYSTEILKKNNFLFNSEQTLIPVPIHWYKENLRGFNQSIELGRNFVKKMGWHFASDLIVKKVFSKNQAGLDRTERKNNVKGVFSISSNYAKPPSDCILFDDVYTTGFTLKEACKVLKRNGVQKVWGLTVAK